MKKKNQVKAVIALLLVVTMIFGLVACGSNDAPDSTPAPPTDGTSDPAQASITLNVATAGDTNMVDFFNDWIGPAFTAQHPHILINVVGTGPGDDGSRTILTMWDAQQHAGSEAWNIDVACVHESVMQEMIEGELLNRFVPNISNARYVNTPASRMALGFNIEGYAVPMFQSQIVLAYNPDTVSNPPQTFEELELWIQDNPGRFGYNGVIGGMSGVGFATAWVYWATGDYEAIALEEYDESVIESWPAVIERLRALPVTYTQGNAGTLDMLNRGEIDMGPVWVDMLLLWQADGRMNPNVRKLLPAPGMPGQPMYMVVGAGSAHSEAAQLFVDFIASPEVQALYVVERSGWNPGIDPTAVFEVASPAAIDMLFSQISADQFARYGLAMPVLGFRTDLIRIFEETR